MFHTFAKVSLQGYIGGTREVGKSLKIRVSYSESWKDRDGQPQKRDYWNTVTLFDSHRGYEWLKENLKVGDLVYIEAKVRDSSYEKDGQTVYDTTLVAETVAIVPTGRGEE